MTVRPQVNGAVTQFTEECGFPSDTLALFVIDKVSSVNTSFIGLSDNRLRQLTGVQRPFGGFGVVLAGDMHQLPPIGGHLWCADMVQAALRPGGGPVLFDNGNGPAGVVGSRDRGLAALCSMQLVQLTRLMRAEGDPDFAAAQMSMRRPDVDHPVDGALLDRLAKPDLLYKAADINADEAWRFAPHGVTGMADRQSVTGGSHAIP
jgi:hypothetical protein